tara:strand:+ start:137 stop:592 length:456 start_codon:yes stop_codon:yes gene_type:complete
MTRAAEMAKIVGKGSVAIHGEAGTTSSGSTGLTTNLQQGLAKAWLNFNGSGTIAARDSFNLSGLTDVSQGNYTVTMSSTMGNVNYSFSGGVAEDGAGGGCRLINFGNNLDSGTLDPNFTTTAYSVNTFFANTNGDEFDVTFIATQVFGDLA